MPGGSQPPGRPSPSPPGRPRSLLGGQGGARHVALRCRPRACSSHRRTERSRPPPRMQAGATEPPGSPSPCFAPVSAALRPVWSANPIAGVLRRISPARTTGTIGETVSLQGAFRSLGKYSGTRGERVHQAVFLLTVSFVQRCPR